MNNQENQDKNKKLEMIDLNKPKTNDGVGVFFAVCRLAIANTAWARKDFNAVAFTEQQLEYLEKYCQQEFGANDSQPDTEKKPQEAQGEEKAPEANTNASQEEKAPEKPAQEEIQKKNSNNEKVEETEEEIDPNDKGEKRKVKMPDSIFDKVMSGVEASKNPPKMPNVKEEPMPKTKEEYEQIF